MSTPGDTIPPFLDDYLNENGFNQFLFSQLNDNQGNHLQFVFIWKRYEYLTLPKLLNLAYKQYPLLKNADADYQKHINTVEVHCIFNTAEFVWNIMKHNNRNKHPSEVYPELHVMAMSDMNSPGYGREYYDRSNPPHHLIEAFGEQRGWKIATRHNKEMRRGIAYLEKFNNEVITALQKHLLQLLPQLLDMNGDWWKMYKFLLTSGCNEWRDSLNEMEHLLEHNMTGDWLDKPFPERQEEVDKIMAEKHKIKYSLAQPK